MKADRYDLERFGIPIRRDERGFAALSASSMDPEYAERGRDVQSDHRSKNVVTCPCARRSPSARGRTSSLTRPPRPGAAWNGGGTVCPRHSRVPVTVLPPSLLISLVRALAALVTPWRPLDGTRVAVD